LAAPDHSGAVLHWGGGQAGWMLGMVSGFPPAPIAPAAFGSCGDHLTFRQNPAFATVIGTGPRRAGEAGSRPGAPSDDPCRI